MTRQPLTPNTGKPDSVPVGERLSKIGRAVAGIAFLCWLFIFPFLYVFVGHVHSRSQPHQSGFSLFFLNALAWYLLVPGVLLVSVVALVLISTLVAGAVNFAFPDRPWRRKDRRAGVHRRIEEREAEIRRLDEQIERLGVKS